MTGAGGLPSKKSCSRFSSRFSLGHVAINFLLRSDFWAEAGAPVGVVAEGAAEVCWLVDDHSVTSIAMLIRSIT